jgi:hypothetical protein
MPSGTEAIPASFGIEPAGSPSAAPATAGRRSRRSVSAEPGAWSVPAGCFKGADVAILAGGKSLTTDDIDLARDHGCVLIALNRAFEVAPDVAWLYGSDPDRFWSRYPGALEHVGLKITCRRLNRPDPVALIAAVEAGVRVLQHAGQDTVGASADPGTVRGNNSLGHVLSVIAHTGTRRVLLLGADMRPGHWHGGYPGQPEPDYQRTVIPTFALLARQLLVARVLVINCAPRSALPYWPRASLRDVFA